MTLQVGELIDDRYRVLGLLGEGGMGAVYLAENVRIDRKVAIKVLHPHLAAQDAMVVRFEHEARAVARIGSPHIADVIDLGSFPTGERFVIMEYLDGESLAARLKVRGRLRPDEVAPIAIQLLDGLAKVHAAGIVHRDLKPGNVFLTSDKHDDFVKILDFGISKFRTGFFSGPEALTADQEVLGTPTYMAPEYVRGEKVDPRTDLYSVGALLYRCVSGRSPFASTNYLDLLLSVTQDEPRPLTDLAPDVAAPFARLVQKAMAKDPESRFQTAMEFRDAIESWRTRIDHLLAEFLGLKHTPSSRARAAARIADLRTPEPTRREVLPAGPHIEQLRRRQQQVDHQLDELMAEWEER